MHSKEEIEELLAEKCHEDLIQIGKRAEMMANMGLGMGSTPNPENAARKAILNKDPYAHLREKTQMKRDGDDELAVLPK